MHGQSRRPTLPKQPSDDNLKAYIVKLLVTIAILALVFAAWSVRHLLLLLFGAVLVSVILRLVAAPFHRRLGANQGLSLAIAVTLLAGLFSTAFWLFGAEVTRQTRSLDELIPVAWQSLQARLDAWGIGEPVRAWLASFGTDGGTVSSFGRFAVTIGNGIADTLLVIVGGIYLAAQPDLYRTGAIKLIPERSRGLAAAAIDESAETLRLWLKGRLVSMVAVGILTAIGLFIIGVPSWLSLGLLSALLEFIPFLGPIIAAIPAVLLALAFSPEAAIWTALLYLIVQQIEGNLIEPLVQQRAVTIPPMLLLFAVVGAGLSFGIAGIILGAPLTVVIYVLVKHLYVREALHTKTPLPTEENH